MISINILLWYVMTIPTKQQGKEVEKLLNGISVIKLDPENLHANEIGVAKVKEQLDPIKEVDCMIAVGSGTIHDLTRYNAYERKIPFISVPTAASVDGYVSTVAAMSWYGFKKSMIAESPILVVADSRIITDAPMRLTASESWRSVRKIYSSCRLEDHKHSGWRIYL